MLTRINVAAADVLERLKGTSRPSRSPDHAVREASCRDQPGQLLSSVILFRGSNSASASPVRKAGSQSVLVFKIGEACFAHG